jgi:uncharacterized membrane protein YhiD involved in acid resistance
MSISIDQAAISLGAATLMGARIGLERQWRQRMAGLRTNGRLSLEPTVSAATWSIGPVLE